MITDFITHDIAGNINDVDVSDLNNSNLEDNLSDDSMFDMDDDALSLSELNAESVDTLVGVDTSLESEEVSEPDSEIIDHKEDKSHISFTGWGECHCLGCKCKKFVGYGDVCDNCGHYFDRHW